MKILASLLVLCSLSWATARTVKSSGGDFTTISACAAASVAGDTCTVFASASPQSGWTQAASGSAGNLITFIVNTGDTVIVNSGITLSGRSFIRISGFTLNTSGAAIVGNASSTHNQIDHNTGTIGGNLFRIPDGLGSTGANNIISNNTVVASGTGNLAGLYLYGDSNLIDSNDFQGFDGDCMDLGGQNVVVRNNICHDVDGAASLQHIDFIQVQGANTIPTLSFSLIENNTEKNCTNDSGNCHFLIIRACSAAGSCTLVADTNIVRFNYAQNLDSQGPVSIGGGGDSVPHATVYNNTIAPGSLYNGNGSCISWQTGSTPDPPGTATTDGRAFNNICYNTATGTTSFSPFIDFDAAAHPANAMKENGNLVFTTAYAGGFGSPYSTESTYAALHSQNPLFANFPADDSLQSTSPAKGAGAALTTVSSGCNSASLVLADSHFFQPGWAGTQADWVRVGAATTAQITAINYSTNTVSFGGSVSCTNGNPVYLYKDSNGNQKLFSSSPDVGAFQFAGGQASPATCSPTSGYFPQSVVCTNPNSGTIVACYTTNGATPATNGLGTGCTTGTIYTTTISVASAETIKVIAGTSTLSDSTVNSYTYVAPVTASASTCSPGTSGYSAPPSPACTNPNSNPTIQCYTLNGSTPSTNLLGTSCTAGTALASGSDVVISATVPQTVKIIAGTNRGPDSSVNTYVYTPTIGGIPFFGLDINTSGSYPPQSSVASNCLRLWDTPGSTRTFIETSAGVYNFATFDAVLALANSAGVSCVQMPLARTPHYISSNTNLVVPGTLTSGVFTAGETVKQSVTLITATVVSQAGTNLTISEYAGTASNSNTWIGQSSGAIFTPNDFPDGCDYFVNGSVQPSQLSGQCSPPTDINPTGIGTDLSFRNFVAALAKHVNASGYSTTHAVPHIYETWNEPESCGFWNSNRSPCTGTGSMNQLVRMEWDAACILHGVTGTNPFNSSETCANVWAAITSVSVTSPIDPTAIITAPSATPFGFTFFLQNFLYCNQAPVPANCTVGGAQWADVINYHFKYLNPSLPLSGSTCPPQCGGQGIPSKTPEATADLWQSQIQATLQPAEQAKAIYSSEGGSATGSFSNCPSVGTGTTPGPPYCNYADPDMQTSYVSRFFIKSWDLGYPNAVWYNWPVGLPAAAAIGYTQTAQWMAGGSNWTGCVQSAPGTTKTGLFTFTCPFTQANGVASAVIWDNSQDCSSGVCTTNNQTVDSSYLSYTDLSGSLPTSIIAHQVPVGIKPLLLQALAVNPPSPFTYSAFTGIGLVPPPTAPSFGTYLRNGATFFDTSYNSSGYSGRMPPVTRCTDSQMSSVANYQSYAAGANGAGFARYLFNKDDTALQITSNSGITAVAIFNPLTMKCGPSSGPHAGSGFAITTDMDTAGGGSSSSITAFGDGAFSASDPALRYYADFVFSAANAMQIGTTTINTSSGAYTDNGITVDLSLGLPLGANISAYQTSHAYTTGTYVSYTLSGSEAPSWQSLHPYILGDLVYANGCLFKDQTIGTSTSGSVSPTFPSTCTVGTLALDGTVKWGGTASANQFIYQLVSSNCTSGSSTPAFVPVSTGHPDILTQVTDNTCTWINVGPNVIKIGGNTGWVSFGGVSIDGTRFCESTSTNTYGWIAGPSGGLANYQSAPQGSGIYSICYSTSLNEYFLINTATGITTTATCSGGTGYQCTGGSIVLATQGSSSVITTGSCQSFFLHSAVTSTGDDYYRLDPQGNSVFCTASLPNPVVWAPFATFNATTAVQVFLGKLNHSAMGINDLVFVGQQGAFNGGFSGGAYSGIYSLSNPGSTPNVNWLINPCDSRAYTPNIVYSIAPCQLSNGLDQHIATSVISDSYPVCGAMYNVQTLNPNAYAPYQGEIVCVSTVPDWVYGGPSTNETQWRFTHTFNTGTNSGFSTQFDISQFSPSGKFMAFSTNNMCGFGNSAGTGTTLCGLNWQPSFLYTTGTNIHAFSATSGGGTNFGVWKITTPGTSAASIPAFVVCNSGNVGTTVTDSNGVVYTCQGSANDRGDILITRLVDPVSNVPAPCAVCFVMGEAKQSFYPHISDPFYPHVQ